MSLKAMKGPSHVQFANAVSIMAEGRISTPMHIESRCFK